MASKRIQTSFRIDGRLWKEFRHALVDSGEKMTPAIEDLIRGFLAKREGRPAESRLASAVPTLTTEESLTIEQWKLLRMLANALQNLPQPKQPGLSVDSELALEFLDQLPVVAVVKRVVGDLDYRVIWANRAYSTLTKKSQSELIGKTAKEIWGDTAEGLKYAEQILEHEKMVVTEKQYHQFTEGILIEGQMRDRLTLRFPILDEDREVVRIGVVALDLPDKASSSHPVARIQYASRNDRA